jgi:hypothetical protein
LTSCDTAAAARPPAQCGHRGPHTALMPPLLPLHNARPHRTCHARHDSTCTLAPPIHIQQCPSALPAPTLPSYRSRPYCARCCLSLLVCAVWWYARSLATSSVASLAALTASVLGITCGGAWWAGPAGSAPGSRNVLSVADEGDVVVGAVAGLDACAGSATSKSGGECAVLCCAAQPARWHRHVEQ